jgi:hypothetical protein
MYECMYVCLYVCACVDGGFHVLTATGNGCGMKHEEINLKLCMNVCMYVYMCVRVWMVVFMC